MEFLTALQSTEGGDCADAELINTKSDIESIRMGCPRSDVAKFNPHAHYVETRNREFGIWYWVGLGLPWSWQTEARGQKFRDSNGDLEPKTDEIRWHPPGVA